MIAALPADLDSGVERSLVAAGFHEAFGRATVTLAAATAAAQHLDTVVLTGGVFQNARLTDVVESGLRELGLEVLVHATIPRTTVASASAKRRSRRSALVDVSPISRRARHRTHTRSSARKL